MTSETRLRAQAAQVRGRLLLAVGLGVSGGFIVIAQAFIVARVVHDVMVAGQGLADVMPRLIVLPLLMLLRAVLAWISECVAFSASASVRQSLRLELFRKLLDIGPVQLRGDKAGEAATVVVDGVEALEGYYARYLPHMAVMALVPLSILAAVVPTDLLSAGIMLATAPFIPFFTVLIGKGAERLNQRQWDLLARLGGYFLDRVNGLATLKMFNASRREAEMILRMSESYRCATMLVLYVAFLSALVLEFFATVSVAVMAVIIGFRLLNGGMAFHEGFTILLLAPEFYLPLRQMGTHYHSRLEAIGAAERILEILDTDTPVFAAKGVSLTKSSCLTISIEDVSCRYRPDAPKALSGVSLTLKSGERVALVGPSGAGKSSLASLLTGFIKPDSGSIRVNGLDLSVYDAEQWREMTAWIPQRPYIFHGSIADNIRLGREDASDEELLKAARSARCEEFIGRLTHGIHTLIGENGAGLSGGEARRMALARAFLRDAPLIVMDEPTAGLDAHSEALIREALNELALGRTLITIAHRHAAIRDAERIVVMDQGRIAGDGVYDSLAGSNLLFARIIRGEETP